jgi:hypothetical protein
VRSSSTRARTPPPRSRRDARRRALDLALREIEQGLPVPSTKWRRRYSLLLGLERVLSEDEPRLADGTSLNPHQVDALSGTLTALLTLQQGNGSAVAPPVGAPVLAVDEEPEEDDDGTPSLLPRRRRRRTPIRTRTTTSTTRTTTSTRTTTT